MTEEIDNMRVRFYGVQGSDAIYPDCRERASIHDLDRDRLLRKVFDEIAGRDHGRTSSPELAKLLEGDCTPEAIEAYRRSLQLELPVSYGGWTTCVHVETSEGNDIVLDCGTGFRNCAVDLQEKWGDAKKRQLFILGSHSHIDHTIGFDQAAVCHDPRNLIHVVGNEQFLTALDRNLGVFTQHVSDSVVGVQTPLHFEMMAATFEGTLIVHDYAPKSTRHERLAAQTFSSSRPLKLGKTSIRAFEVYHPAPCLAYRVDHGNKSFVFCTDHELRHGNDANDPQQKASLIAEQRLREIAADADLLYRDGQFQRPEYDGEVGIGRSAPLSRMDWGHSCIEDILEMAAECRINETLIGHHDPSRTWQERSQLDERLAQHQQDTGQAVRLARAETVVNL